MMLLLQIIVVVTAAEAIAFKHNQYSVLYSADKSASYLAVPEKILQSTSVGPDTYSSPSPTSEYSRERGTSVVTVQPVYKRNDKILVKKPPAPFQSDGGSGCIDGSCIENAPVPITTGSTNLQTDDTTSIVPSDSLIVPSDPTMLVGLGTANVILNKGMPLTSRITASATPARVLISTSPDPGTSQNIADASVTLASTKPASSPNVASVTARSEERNARNTTTKQTTEPTNSPRIPSTPLTPSFPIPPSPIPSSTVATPTPTSSSTSNSKTPIVIGVGVGIGIAVALTILGVILIVLKRRRSRTVTPPQERASLPRYVDNKRELDAGIEHLAPQEIDGLEIGGPQELFTFHNVPEMGSARDASQELMTSDNVHEMG